MGWKENYIAKFGVEAYEKRKAYERDKYRKKVGETTRFKCKKLSSVIMNVKINLPMPEAETKEERAEIVSKIEKVFQKEIRKRWARERTEASIITVEGNCKVPKGITIYSIECVLGHPYTPELYNYFKALCKEIVKEE